MINDSNNNSQPIPAAKTEKSGGGMLYFWIFFILIGALFLTPLPQILTSFIPKEWFQAALSSHYQEIILEKEETNLTEPRKFDHPDTTLPIIGMQSGLCFRFDVTSKKNGSDLDKMIKAAGNNEAIAEIIAMSPDRKEYQLKEMLVYSFYSDERNYTMICQNFGTEYSSLPLQIEAVYVRPLKPFTFTDARWRSVKDLR